MAYTGREQPDAMSHPDGARALRDAPSRRIAESSRRAYYGWKLVAALAVTEAVSWGVLYYAFTVFLSPMHRELGWSRASLSGAFSLALLLSGLVGLPIGRWLDRHGARLLMTAGSCAAVVLLLAWSRVHTLLTFYLIWMGIGLTMGAVLYEPAFVVVAAWFRRQRAQALGVLTFVAGFASVVFVPLAGVLVTAHGWRDALVILAVILGLVTIPLHALVLRRRPADLGLAPDGEAMPSRTDETSGNETAGVTLRAALAGITFWLLMGAFCLSTLATGVVFVYLVPYLTDAGYSTGLAATIVGVIGLAALPGRLALTVLGGRVRRSVIASSIFGSQAVAFLVLLLVPGLVGVFGFALLFGAGFGAITPTRAALVADYYGSSHYGSINGAGAFILNGARALAPVSAGIVFALTGGYTAIFWGLGALSAVATLTMLSTERQAAHSGLVAGPL